MESFIQLDSIDLVLCLGIIGIAIALSLWQKLELEKQLVYGAVRSLIQLILIGEILYIIFDLDNWLAVV